MIVLCFYKNHKNRNLQNCSCKIATFLKVKSLCCALFNNQTFEQYKNILKLLHIYVYVNLTVDYPRATSNENTDTAQKMKFYIKDFFRKCDQIRNFLRIWSHLLKKSLMENFIFCAVLGHFTSILLKLFIQQIPR